MSGYGNVDIQGLKQAVDKVVREFIRAQSTPDEMSAEEKQSQIEELRRRDDERLETVFFITQYCCCNESRKNLGAR